MRDRAFVLGLFLLLSSCLLASPLVTGNGFGFAVVSPETGQITKFYAHPYSFARPDPADALSEGIPTANFVKALGWKGAASRITAEYVNDSHVVRTNSAAGSCTTFMPFGLREAALIVACVSSNDARELEVQWERPVKTDSTVEVGGAMLHLLDFNGIEEKLLLIPLEQRGTSSSGLLSGSNAWALVSLETGEDVNRVVSEFKRWRGGLAPQELAKREIEELEHWRVKAPSQLAGPKELHLWRQSETLLRVAQSREPNRPGRYNYGMIAACLPDGAFSNYWARDMAFATVALIRMGHREEARAAVLAYFNARPTGKMRDETGGNDYQVSVVRYFGDGSEEPFFTQEGAINIEYDDWGLALWVLGEYVKKYDDLGLLRETTYRGSVYESARDFIAKPLQAELEEYKAGLIVAQDTSIWEEHQKDKKHFAWSTALAIVGLRNFAELAHRNGDEATSKRLHEKVALLQKGFDAAFIRDGKLHGTLEEGIKNDIDGALLAIVHFGIVKDPAIIRSTLDRMELLKVASGGYRRVRGTYTDPAIYEYWYEQEEFVFVDFSYAEVQRQMGRKDLADRMLRRIVDKSAGDHYFVPEMYVAVDCKLFHGAIGDPTGAIPMVGYGAGVFVMDVLGR
jgi:hypothetical protein